MPEGAVRIVDRFLAVKNNTVLLPSLKLVVRVQDSLKACPVLHLQREQGLIDLAHIGIVVGRTPDLFFLNFPGDVLTRLIHCRIVRPGHYLRHCGTLRKNQLLIRIPDLYLYSRWLDFDFHDIRNRLIFALDSLISQSVKIPACICWRLHF